MPASICACGICQSGRDSIWGAPHGLAAWPALTAMALMNQAQNRAALNALAPCPGERVIELGCGPGMGVREALKRVGPNGFVAGVDHSAAAAHCAAHASLNAVIAGRALIMRADVADLPFRDRMFDRAFAVGSFQFWPDPARALREIARVIAPGGRLVITQRAGNPDRPGSFAGAGEGLAHIAQAGALLKAQGWRLIDERRAPDGPRLIAVSLVAERAS